MKITSFYFTTFFIFSCAIIACQQKKTPPNYTFQTNKKENIIITNKGKYARDIHLFGNNDISARLKKLMGPMYLEMVEKFNVQSPICSESNIYKITGCQKNNCPTYMVTILFDSKKDNLHVLINQNGKIKDFFEKEKITISSTLKKK